MSYTVCSLKTVRIPVARFKAVNSALDVDAADEPRVLLAENVDPGKLDDATA